MGASLKLWLKGWIVFVEELFIRGVGAYSTKCGIDLSEYMMKLSPFMQW